MEANLRQNAYERAACEEAAGNLVLCGRHKKIIKYPSICSLCYQIRIVLGYSKFFKVSQSFLGSDFRGRGSKCHLSLKEANGLTKAINLTTNITSLAVFLYNGTVLIPLGILAGLCNVTGNWIGVSFFDKKGGAVVKPVMLLVLTVFLARTIMELIAG